MKDYHYLLIVIVLILVVYKWMKMSVKNQNELFLFDKEFNLIESMIMNGDRDSRYTATTTDDLIEKLEKKSFCKATHRQINDLKILWRSKFLHLFPAHHIIK